MCIKIKLMIIEFDKTYVYTTLLRVFLLIKEEKNEKSVYFSCILTI